jgi:hypothetical protein
MANIAGAPDFVGVRLLVLGRPRLGQRHSGKEEGRRVDPDGLVRSFPL